MNTEKQHKKNHFNMIDFVLILAVVACVVGIALRKDIVSEIAKTEDTAQVTVFISAILNESVGQLIPDDVYYDVSSGGTFGTLLSFEAKPAEKTTFDDDGQQVIYTYETRSDVYATFRISGFDSQNGFMMNNKTYIGVGSSFTIHSKNLSVSCQVMDIQTEEKQ